MLVPGWRNVVGTEHGIEAEAARRLQRVVAERAVVGLDEELSARVAPRIWAVHVVPDRWAPKMSTLGAFDRATPRP